MVFFFGPFRLSLPLSFSLAKAKSALSFFSIVFFVFDRNGSTVPRLRACGLTYTPTSTSLSTTILRRRDFEFGASWCSWLGD